MDHIGDGSSWIFQEEAMKILPPKTGEKEWDWYSGTADAAGRPVIPHWTRKWFSCFQVITYMDFPSYDGISSR